MKYFQISLLIIVMLVSSCQKTSVYFSDNTITEDPNITIWDNYAVSLSTFKLDSFQTNSDSVWVIGHHADPELGSISAFSFGEIARPVNHPFGNDQIRFDSAALVLVPSGIYYGDTTLPFRIQVFALSQSIGSDTLGTTAFYNTQHTNYLPDPIGQTSLLIHPLKKDTVFIPLDDAFVENLYTQMRNNTLAMTDQNNFRNFFKGVCITADAEQNNTIYQFTNSESVPLIRIFYTEKGLYNQAGYYDLNYIPAKQYNHIAYDPAGSAMSVFADSGIVLAASSLTAHKALLSNLNPTRVKIDFPNLLDITETYPYVKVINASLEIRVDRSLNQLPYITPSNLLLYSGDQSNQLSAYIVSPLTGYPETGNFVSDPLEAEGTKYSFDITGYINTLINEGRFSTQSLFLCPYNDNYFGTGSRLIINTAAADPDIRLKLYVLGL